MSGSRRNGNTSSVSAAGTNPVIDTEPEEEWTVVGEQLVHVELSGVYQDDLFTKNSQAFEGVISQWTGLESAEPIVQIGEQVFAGTFEDDVGTSVFFRCEETSSSSSQDPVFERETPNLKAKFECKTDKKLLLRRVFLGLKETAADQPLPQKEVGT
jgi:hypothetical protein